MTRSEQERIRILEMIARHQISSEEGLSRIKALRLSTGGERSGLTGAVDQATLYCQSYWETVPDITPVPAGPVDCIVIFTDDAALAVGLQKRTGARMIMVKSGDGYRNLGADTFAINPAVPDDYRSFLRELEQQRIVPQKIIHGWSNEKFSSGEDALKSQLQNGIYSVYHLFRSLLEQKINHPVQLLYVYSGAADISDPGGLPQPQYTAVNGFARTICQENPQFAVRTIGIGAVPEQLNMPETLAGILERELAQDIAGAAEIRYENGLREIKRYAEVALDTGMNRLPFHSGGVCLITGGAGGLGAVFAKYLAQEFQAKLILVGRSEINDNGRSLLRELEALGAKAIYIQADITKRPDVERLMTESKARFEKINGVIHSAGILKDSFLLKKNPADMEAVLAPKVYGTVYLDELTKSEPLEFFALFSSLAGVFGNVGQSDYAFANNFMDAFAGWRFAMKHPGKTVSFNWPFWENGRMTADEASLREMSETTGLIALNTAEGVKAFCAGIQSGLTQVMVLSGAAGKIRNWIRELNQERTARSNDVQVIGPDEADKAQLSQKAETFLKQVLAKQTKLPVSEIDSQERFEKYGIDSGMIISLNRELERHFGEVSKTLFFEYRNLHELAQYFAENYSQQLLAIMDSDNKTSARPSRRAKTMDTEKIREQPRSRFIDDRLPASTQGTAGARNIAIIGISGRYPEAKNIETFWENLKAGRDCIDEIPPERWDYHRYYDPDKTKRGTSYTKWGGFIDDFDRFDPLFFNISPIEAEFMDPQERLFLQTVWHTIEDAGYTRNGLSENVGVFVGVMYGQYQLYGAEEMQKGNMIANTSSYASIANRISYCLDFQGPSIAVDTMCSSSLTAIHLACESISRGECGMAVAGGVNLNIHPMKYIQLSQGRFAASDGRCHSFGIDGDGYVPGEGVGSVLLKPLPQAVRDGDHIYAVIKGTSINHGGKTHGFTVPNPNAQANLISHALKKSGVDPRTISYIEAHGTGTSLGDPIEINALAKSFREYTKDKQYCSIGSAKSNIGHLESAAGIAGLTKVVLQMKHRQLVPSIHSEQLNPNINFKNSPFYVQHELTDWNRPVIRENGTEREYPRRAGISAFGAGGSNAHIILEEYLAQNVPAKPGTQPRVAVFSAKTPAALEKYLRTFKLWIEKFGASDTVDDHDKVPFKDFIYTLQTGREAMNARMAVVAAGYSDLAAKLTRYLETPGEQDGVYCGSPRAKTAVNPLRLEGEAGDTFVHSLIQNGEPEQIAGLWASGAVIPWEIGYAEDRPRRVSLPVYPFEEERYWIPTVETPKTGQFVNLHPLIGTNVSTLERQCYQKVITPDEYFVRDHRIFGKEILPGAVYLEMAAAAGNLAVQGRRVRRMKNIVWRKAVGINHESQPLWISLYPGEGGVDFEITTDTEARSGLVHSGGKLCFDSPEEAMKINAIDPEKIKQRCPLVKDGAVCYSEFQKSGFQYGTCFQTIQKLFTSENECLAQLEVPGLLENDFSKYSIHPSLLDGAFQTITGFAQPAAAGLKNLFLPYALDELVILGQLPLKCLAYATVSSDFTPETPKYNIELAGETGEIFVRIKGFTLKAATTALPLGESNGKRSVFYKRNWVSRELALESGSQPLGDTVIFDSGEIFAASLREKYGRINDSSQVIIVKPAAADIEPEAGVYYIAMDDPKAYLHLLDKLASQNISLRNIIYRCPHESFTPQESTVKAQLQQGLFSLLYLTKALIQRKLSRGIRLLYLYESSNQDLQPLDAALGAFMKTVHLEHPGLNYQIVDIRGAKRDHSAKNFNNPGWIAALVCRELRSTRDIQVEVRYEAQSRYINKLQEFQLEAKEQPTIGVWREHGVYLITGGVGGLGFIFARYLAERFKAKLVLVGRSRLNEEKGNKLRALEALGAETMYVAADVSRREDMEELVSKAKARFGRIDGVIHGAGVLRDSLALHKTTEEMSEVLAAKIYGTLNLNEATRGERLDFFALFSSVSAVTGNIGQLDYAYANSFMDYFVDFRIGEKAQGKTVAINWPLWENGGMNVDDNAKVLLHQAGLVPLNDDEGIRIFEACLAAGLSRLFVLTGEPEKINRFLNPEPENPEESMPRGLENSSAEQYRDEVETYIKTTLSKEIKLPVHKIDSQAPLEQYGIDSVMVLNLSHALEGFFGSLSKTLFFEYKSVEELAGYFIQYHPEKVAELGRKPALSAEKVKGTVSAREMVPRSRFLDAPFKENKKKTPETDDIAIIGVSGRYPMAANLHEFWGNLKSGKDCITEIPRERWAYEDYFDPDKNALGKSYSKWGGFIDGFDLFDPLFFNISPREAHYIDPQERLFLETVWRTMEDAGYTRRGLAKNKVGVFVGVMYGQYQLLGGDGSGVSPGSSYASIANRVSYYCNFTGPSIALDTMCSSSLTAIHLACDSLRNGESEVAIAGGVNLSIHPTKYLQLSQGKFLASDGRCRSFGEGGDGYVPGEGVGAVLLKPLHRAISDEDRIYAVIKASAVNHGGKTNGYTVPNPTAQAELIAETLEKAGIAPRTISYIEAHGTGTSLGDPIEIAGLTKAFQEYAGAGTGNEKQYCAIGSAKSNIGHLESAAGIAALTKVLLQMKYKQLVPSLHANTLNPHIKFEQTPFYVQQNLTPWKNPLIMENGTAKRYPLRAGVSAFGAGGSNAHIILEEYNPPIREVFTGSEEFIFVFSAKNGDRLKAYARSMVDFLRKSGANARSIPANQDLIELVQHDLVKMVAGILCISEAELTPAEFVEYGLDQFGLADLTGRINELYHVELGVSVFSDYPSVADLSRYITKTYLHNISEHYAISDPEMTDVPEAQEPVSLADMAFTLQIGRESMQERLAIIAASREQLMDRLTAFIEDRMDFPDVYTGNVTESHLDSQFLVSGREGREFLRIVIDDRQLGKLAQLWISGADIDWKRLYSGELPSRVSLPGYPFARERYWVSPAEPVQDGRQAKRLHPLIDRNESTVAGLCFKKEIHAEDLLLKDYRLGDFQAVPGTIYLEMARAAGSLANRPHPVKELANIVWGAPVSLKEAREVEIGLYPSGENMAWEIRTIADDGRKQISAQGELSLPVDSDTAVPEVVNIEAVQAKCRSTVYAAEFYHIMQMNRMEYGAGLQVVREFFANGEEALARFELPARYIKNLPELGLHPVLLEGITQAIIALDAKSGTKAGRPKALLEAAHVKLVQPLTRTGYIYIEASNQHAEAEGKTFDAKITSADGRISAVIQQIRLEGITISGNQETSRSGNKAKTEYFLEKSWRTSEIPESNSIKVSGATIVLVNEETEALVDRLCGENPDACISIHTAFDYENQSVKKYAVNFHEAAQGVRVIQEILKNEAEITALIDLSDLHSHPVGTGSMAMGKIAMLQELIKSINPKPLTIVHVTRGLQDFQMVQPSLDGAGMAGLVKMLGAEYNKVCSKTIDIDLSFDKTEELVGILRRELDYQDLNGEICYREGKRYVPYLSQEDRKAEKTANLAVNPGKVIVITGGTRGIGMEVARHLVHRGARKLVLMGVQQLPERSRWQESAVSPDTAPGVAAKLKTLLELEGAGAHVELYTGSLMHRAELREFFKGVRRRMGDIGGVVHCAGAMTHNNPAFIHKTEDDFLKVLEPKVDALEVLHEIFKNDPLQFFILFSSVSGLVPALAPGVSDYAAANAYLNYFAAYQKRQGYRYYKSVSWPMWTGTGMASNTSPLYYQMGFAPLMVPEGLALFDSVLQLPNQVPIMPCLAFADRFNPAELLNVKQALKPKPMSAAVPIPEPRAGRNNTDTVAALKVLFAAELKIPEGQLNETTNFADYGVDSILLAELVKKVEVRFRRTLEPGVFLEYPTLKSLGSYLNRLQRLETPPQTVAVPKAAPEESKPLHIGFQRGRVLQTKKQAESWNTAAANTIEPERSKVAVIGIGCHFPGAGGKEEYWTNLAAGRSSITEVPISRWDIRRYYSPEYQPGKSISKWGGFIDNIEYFDPEFFNISEAEALQMDPLIRQFLEISVETIQDAGYTREELSNKKVGVFVGSRAGYFASRVQKMLKNSVSGTGQNFIAAYAAHFLNLKGPNMVVDTACSSSLVSIHLACQSLMLHESELALAGGVDILLDEKPYIVLSEGRALSPDGKCHTFDEKANGFVPGEGCGAVLLKTLDKALADGDQIYAVIDASAINNDGRTMGITTPNPEAQSTVIKEALIKAGANPDSISYVEAHGTGTMIGDPIELRALTRVFRESTMEKQFCAVGSVKTNMGHLLSAAGIASFIKVALSLHHKQLPPTLNCETPNPRFEFESSPFYQNTRLQDWKPREGIRRAGISSFGFGGTNAHMIVSEAPDCKGDKQTRHPLPPIKFNRRRFWFDTNKGQVGNQPGTDVPVPDSAAPLDLTVKTSMPDAFLKFLGK